MKKLLLSFTIVIISGYVGIVENLVSQPGIGEVVEEKIDINDLVLIWRSFFMQIVDWRDIVRNCEPKYCGCGIIYELNNPLDRSNESCAIADMNIIDFTEPHYHPYIEIYFVIEGSGLIVVNGQERYIQRSDVIIIPPFQAHFVFPEKNLVIGCVNTPPFEPEHYKAVTKTDLLVGFDCEQFERIKVKKLEAKV